LAGGLSRYYVERGLSFQVSAGSGVAAAVRQNLAMASSGSPSDGNEREVFAGLPNARPQRRSAKRDRPARGADAQDAPRTGASPKPRPAARTKTAAKPKASAKRAAASEPKAASKVPPAGYATPTDDDGLHGADLVGTALRAVGELAQIGVAAGGRALKGAIQRLPRP
jgi:hypothetical protein